MQRVPFTDSFEVATFRMDVEIGRWRIVPLHQHHGQALDPCVTLQILQQTVDAVTETDPPDAVVSFVLSIAKYDLTK